MAKDDEDFKPAPVAHTIGEDLARLSVEELEHRISALKTEITRLEQAITAKNASRLAADQFFKR
jgi:uncharacterized small protein (DUF1192 family)